MRLAPWPALHALLLLARASSAPAQAARDLRRWIPQMKVRTQHGSSLAELARQHRVVVVMTTIPPRIQKIEPVLDSMLSQTWPVAKVYLSVPYRYNRTGELYTIPAWLRSKPGITIARCEDLGPGTHLLNGLRLESDPWTFMAVVDDDHIYSPDLVETLMRAALAHPGVAVAAQGFLSIPGLEIDKNTPRYLHDQGFAAGPVLVSYLGVVYQRGFFDDSVFDYSRVATQCHYQDDMWFSAHLARKGIRRMVLGAAVGVQELKEMHLGPSSLTFWQENKPREVSEECNKSLLRLYADLWAYRRRMVLSVSGLPPLLPPVPPSLGSHGGVDGDQGDWGKALRVLRGLPWAPDLTYLCTEGLGSGGAARDHKLGSSFWLGGVLVTGSNACSAYAAEPRVGQLIRDPLQWEGDSNTVVVVGTLKDVMQQSADIGAIADCAAERYRAGDDADGATADQGRRSDDDSPFCRIGELAAVSVGAFGGSFTANAHSRM